MFSETYFSGLFKQNKRPLINRPPCYYLIPEWKCAHFYPIRCEQCSVSSPRFSVSAGHWCRLPACLDSWGPTVRERTVRSLRSIRRVRCPHSSFTRTCPIHSDMFVCLPSRTCPFQPIVALRSIFVQSVLVHLLHYVTESDMSDSAGPHSFSAVPCLGCIT